MLICMPKKNLTAFFLITKINFSSAKGLFLCPTKLTAYFSITQIPTINFSRFIEILFDYIECKEMINYHKYEDKEVYAI